MDPGARVDQEDPEGRRDQPSRLNPLGNPGDPGDQEDPAGREVQADQQLDDQENQGGQVDLVDRGDREVLMAREDQQQKHLELQVRMERVRSDNHVGDKSIHSDTFSHEQELSETKRVKSIRKTPAVQAVVA